ncbi:MAG TPA: M28 family peptidase [Candidatus Angelobacter sp.]|jgi:putative aminopeptidase FrvX
MFKILRQTPCLVPAILLFSWACVSAQNVQYKPVSREIVESRLEKYAGNDKQREATLKQMFTDAGCGDQQISEQPVRGSKLSNVICTLPGSSGKTIIVGAHFDHISDGDGVVDNWSGASLLPSLYEALKAVPRKHTYVFVGFAEEEKGLVGSEFYVGQMRKGQIAATDAMVNMDTLGLAPTEIWGSHADRGLNAAITLVARQIHVTVTDVDVERIGTADSESFAEKRIPSITIHSLTPEAWKAHILHSSKDKITAIHKDDYYQSYGLIAAYLAFLDQISREQLERKKH